MAEAIITSLFAGAAQLNGAALPVAGTVVVQTSTTTALALPVPVEPFAKPAPSLLVPSQVARLVRFIRAFFQNTRAVFKL